MNLLQSKTFVTSIFHFALSWIGFPLSQGVVLPPSRSFVSW